MASATAELVRGAVAETLKYSTKPADMVADPEWVLELTKQTHKRRFVATGGALKDILKLDQETDADMVIGFRTAIWMSAAAVTVLISPATAQRWITRAP